MDANAYQRLAARTLIDEPDSRFTSNELAVMLEALDLAAKCGAVMEYLKKGICHRHGFDFGHLETLLAAVRESSICVHDAYKIPLNTRVPINEQMHIWNALGLIGEAGEIADLITAVEYGNLDREKLTKELGDIEWYAAAICTRSGLSLSDVMEHNITKLEQRYPNGYSSEDSKKRVDAHE